jgi:hypothetical protein
LNTDRDVDAKYITTGVNRFSGNPFIEALPKLEGNKADLLTSLSHYPAPPTSTTRRLGEVVRIMELSVINDIIIPFPEYQKASLALTTMMRETYVARNPLTAVDRQRRHAIAARDDRLFPANWKSSAKGHLMMAHSGMGKTTFATAFLLRYPQVVTHVMYQGRPLRCEQVVYLVLRVPHDATLKSLCLRFFAEIDSLLGTNYVRQARSVRQIAPMVQLMHEVATAISLGSLIVDEVQNLKHARGGHAEIVLNLFSEIIERLGISLLVLATPAVQPVIEGSVRNGRKLTSYGETVMRPMKRNDPQWHDFCETYWDYTFVRNVGKLDKIVRDAWYDASAGNTAFAVLVFMLAQRNEIGGREIVDAAAIERTAATDMAFLQPAIAALRSGNPDKLRAFDDLIFSPKYRALRKLLGANDLKPGKSTVEEFDDTECRNQGISNSINEPRKARQKRPTSGADIELPIEDPLTT